MPTMFQITPERCEKRERDKEKEKERERERDTNLKMSRLST